tara:strand:+ start:97 stop:831 length:735 start_codon:yes stop_codon:yes gene_type:complete
MAFDTKYLLDDNKDFIYFTGKISKHIMSKKTQKLIGVNINDLVVFDKFNKNEAKDLLSKLQEENFKIAKKEIPRPYLVLFAPKVVNRSLETIDKFPVGTYIKFKISYGYHKEKKKKIYNAADLEYYKEHSKNIEKRYGTGIFINSKFTPIDQITFKSDVLIQLLDKIYDNQMVDIDNILSLNSLINNWLAKGIEVQKRKEYEEERKKLELSKKEEAEESSKALVEALQSVKAIYKESLQKREIS